MISVNFTLLVQLANFLILLVILNYLLFKPVLRVLDEREKLVNESAEAKERLGKLASENIEEYESRLLAAKQEAMSIRAAERTEANTGFRQKIQEARVVGTQELEKARQIAARVGLDRTFNDLEIRLNRAAEKAAPLAKELFWQAIGEMTITDIREIFNGPDDAATRYFSGKMSPRLTVVMRPVVDKSLGQVGAVQVYKKLLGEYNAIPFAPKIEADLTAYVVSGGMAGIFHYLAEEEAEIRHNTAKRTTEILRRVFGR